MGIFCKHADQLRKWLAGDNAILHQILRHLHKLAVIGGNCLNLLKLIVEGLLEQVFRRE